MQYEGPCEKFSLDSYREEIAKKLSGKETWSFVMMKDTYHHTNSQCTKKSGVQWCTCFGPGFYPDPDAWIQVHCLHATKVAVLCPAHLQSASQQPKCQWSRWTAIVVSDKRRMDCFTSIKYIHLFGHYYTLRRPTDVLMWKRIPVNDRPMHRTGKDQSKSIVRLG